MKPLTKKDLFSHTGNIKGLFKVEDVLGAVEWLKKELRKKYPLSFSGSWDLIDEAFNIK